MFKDTQFFRSAFSIKELPKPELPEIILCGRSNVGKSSFINSISANKKLAKTSSIPGKTRSINYYLFEKKLFIVDLPGYGYASVSKNERAYWGKILSEFFQSERKFKAVIHLIDSRHEPTELDIELNSFIKKINLPYFIILNKVDKLKQSEKAQAQKNIKEFFGDMKLNENLFFYSSIDNTGKKEILKLINTLKEN